MTYSPILFRTALTLSAVIGAAAPLTAQALTVSKSEPTSGHPDSAKPLPIPQNLIAENLAKKSTQEVAQGVTDPILSPAPTQVLPLPSPGTSPAPIQATPSTGAPGNIRNIPGPNVPEASPSPTQSPAPGESETPSSETTPDPTQPQLPPSAPLPDPNAGTGAETPQEPDRQVLVSEVLVQGAEGELANQVYEAISTRPGQPTTRSQLQVDINAIFATGYFSAVRAEPSDTPLGVRVTFIVQANPVLKSVQAAGTQILTQDKLNEIFQPQFGKTLNLRELQAGIKRV